MTKPASTEQSREGLHAPHGVLTAMETRRPRTLRLVLQSVGFLLCIAIFGWCISLALSGDRGEQLERLRNASPLALAALAGLAAASVATNGVAFWVSLRPLRRLPLRDVIATNAIATFLAFLPFKLGAISRVLIHRRRDDVHFKELVPWFAAYAALSMATLLPLSALALLRPTLDGVWLAIAAALVLTTNAIGFALGRLSERVPLLAKLSLGSWRIVREPGAVAGVMASKLVDSVIHAGRFLVAASILGVDLSAGRAALYSLAYFLIGVFSPVGMLGLREGGVVALGGAQDFAEDASRIALLVTAAEALILIPLALGAAAYLRVDRLLLRRRPVSASR